MNNFFHYIEQTNVDDEWLDTLPFGVLQLDPEGTVVRYNQYESGLSGRQRDKVIGRNFFRDVAPCAQVQIFEGEFNKAVRERRLDHTFRFHFPFTPPREVEITMWFDGGRNAIWLLIVDIQDRLSASSFVERLTH